MKRKYYCSNKDMCEHIWYKGEGVNIEDRENLCPRCGKVSIQSREIKKVQEKEVD